MMTRIDPPLPVNTSKGSGLAYFVIDYGLDYNLMWIVFLDESGECWTIDNAEIRAYPNPTYGAPRSGKIPKSEGGR
jgi:hypothetical protein